VRVCRKAGTIGMLNWTPEGMIGDLFKTMKPFAPPPPPGAQPPPLWGSEDHIRKLKPQRLEVMGKGVEPTEKLWQPQGVVLPRKA
jgi:hypothetical protein